MAADAGRAAVFANALRDKVQPGHVVLDIGTGIGIWAFVACRLGARKVYAVESDDIIHGARKAAIANGFADRIEFIHDLTTRIDLPQKVDGIVSDIRGAMPLFRGSLATLKDARSRFLKPGGWMIPERDTLWAALVHDPDAYQEFVGFWDSRPLDFDFSTFRSAAASAWGSHRIAAEATITAAVQWATIDYSNLSGVGIRGRACWRMDRQSTGHGLCVWFDMEEPAGRLSNSPLTEEGHVYSRGFFPWRNPVDLAIGDTVDVELAADPMGDDYLWRWNTRVTTGEGSAKAAFEQSTFDGTHLSVDQLRRRAHSHVPRLNADGEIDRLILDRFGDGDSLESVAREVARQFPGQFPTWRNALLRVGVMSAKYSR
jgi:type I protein arginine methyltransferase